MINHVPNQIKENIILAQAGSIEARNQVLEFIYPFIKDKCKDKETQQNTILRIVKYLNSFCVEKGNFIHWSMTIMRNTRLKAWNDYNSHREKEKCFANYSQAEFQTVIFNTNKTQPKEFEFNTLNLNKAIHEIIEGLRPLQKNTFKMWAFEGLKHKEIADYLNITESGSKAQLARAKESIIKQLKTKYHYEQNK